MTAARDARKSAKTKSANRLADKACGRHRAPVRPTPSARAALVWSYLLTVGRFATTAVVTIVMATFLDPRAYGVMALSMAWVTLAQMLALNGPAQAVVQRNEVNDQHYDAAFWVTLASSVALAVVFAAAAPLWASVNGAAELVHVCWALAPAIVLNALVAVPDAILRRHLQFKKLSLRVLFAGITSGVAGIATAIAGYGVWALVVQQLTLTTFSAVAVWAAVRWRPRLAPIRPALRDIRSYSMHSISGSIAYFVSTRADALVLGAAFGPAAIGLYRFAIRITDTVSEVAVGGLGQISLPHLSRFHDDHAAFAARLGRVIHAAALLAFPIFGILAPAASWLLSWIGPQWVDAAPGFRVLCLTGVVGALGAILGAALQAAGRPGMVAAVGWSMAAATTVTMWLVGVRYSDAGGRTQVVAIAATFCAIHAAAVVAASVIMFRKILRVSIAPALLPALPAALSAAAAALTGWSVQPLLTGASSFSGLVVTSAVATVAAGLVLIILDSEVSSRCRWIVGQISARLATTESIPQQPDGEGVRDASR